MPDGGVLTLLGAKHGAGQRQGVDYHHAWHNTSRQNAQHEKKRRQNAHI